MWVLSEVMEAEPESNRATFLMDFREVESM